MRFVAAPDPEFVGLTAGAKQTFVLGPARISNLVRQDIAEVLDALKRGERTIIVNDERNPALS